MQGALLNQQGCFKFTLKAQHLRGVVMGLGRGLRSKLFLTKSQNFDVAWLTECPARTLSCANFMPFSPTIPIPFD